VSDLGFGIRTVFGLFFLYTVWTGSVTFLGMTREEGTIENISGLTLCYSLNN